MLPRLRSTLLVVLLLSPLAGLPAVSEAGLAVGEPTPFDPVKIRAVRSQEAVAAAANDSVTLFVWTDFRSGNADVFAARVRNNGDVLDPNGIPVALTGVAETAPTVSWSGSDWLVAWERAGVDVYASRVAIDGEVLDPSGIAIAATGAVELAPAAAGLGGRHLLLWNRLTANQSVDGAIVAPDGTFDVAPTVLSLGATPTDTRPAVAVRDTAALVAFVTTRNGTPDIYGFRMRRSTSGPASLVRMDAADVAIAAGPDRVDFPAVGAGPNGWLVAWSDSRNAATANDIFAARVNAAGAVQDANGIEVSDDAGSEVHPAVHHNGNEWLVAWSQENTGQFLRAVANNGNPAAQRIDVSTASGTLGEGVFGGDPDKPILAWSDPEPGTFAPKPPQDLLGRLVANDLSLETPFVIATQTPNQTQPALAFGANRWFVAWVDDRFGPLEGRLRFAVTDSARFEAPAPASIGFVAVRPRLDQQQPTACFDGTNFNLFWTEERGGRRQVFGARFTPGGAFVDSFQVTSGAWDHTEPTVTRHTGALLFLVWTDARLPGDLDLWGRRILNGVPTGDEALISGIDFVQESTPNFSARVVDPGDFSSVLVYQTRTSPETGAIRLRFLSANPELESSTELNITTDPSRIFEKPRLAWNGENWFVAYQELVENDGPALYVPWGNWLDVGFNTVSGQQAMGPGSYVPSNPVVASTGHNYLTAWSSLDAGQVDLDLRRVGMAGYLDAPIPFTDDAPVDVPGAALQGQGDRAGFAYTRQQADTEWNGLRLFGAEARDSLVGKIVINEFLANPPMGTEEFLELFNVSGQSFNLEGWFITVDGDSSELFYCDIGLRTGDPDDRARKGRPDDSMLGTICGEFPDATYHEDFSDFFGIEGSPEEGKLPNRGAVIQLFSPGGVLVDQVGYGFRGGAPVSPPIPVRELPVARADRTPLETQGAGAIVQAPGDSGAISTARLPDGTDSGDDANDFNLTPATTPNSSNQGVEAALGSALFVSRLFWNPPTGSVDAVELFNPTVNTYDFTGWYLGSNDGTQRIGVANNAWSVLPSLDKRVLRRGEVGSFTTDLDYLTVVYLLDPNFQRVEQLGWSRPDNQQPQMCMAREPDTGGFHNGFDWFTSGGEQNLFAGQLRYVTCTIAAPDATTPVEPGPIALSFRGALPNPVPVAGGVLAFAVPGLPGGEPARVRLRLIDVAGRVRATLVDGALAPGEHRIPLAGPAAGIYYAELEVAGQRLSRPVVIVP